MIYSDIQVFFIFTSELQSILAFEVVNRALYPYPPIKLEVAITLSIPDLTAHLPTPTSVLVCLARFIVIKDNPNLLIFGRSEVVV